MGDEFMLEPCPNCGENKVKRRDNGAIECLECGVVIFTPKSLLGDKVL